MSLFLNKIRKITQQLLVPLGILVVSASGAAQANGVQNLGFESGLTNWSSSVADVVSTITGEENSNGVPVSPFKGSQMLRMGSPKDINEKQLRGLNNVSQTFVPTSDTLRFSFRLFSWEHRGDDTVVINLSDTAGNNYLIHDDTGSPLSISMPDGSTQTCDATPCSFTIDVGKRGQFLNTGWIKAKITGLPTDGNTAVTLSYSVSGSDNEAHATWGYFDDVNTPPVAKFQLSPKNSLEGDFVMFVDQSYDVDPGDSITQWEWLVSGPDIVTEPINTKNPMLVLPSNGSYNVQLTVWDTFGASTVAYSGGVAVDGAAIPSLEVGDAAAKLNALNQEVLVDSEAGLVARFVDPGVLDTHSAEWSIDGMLTSGDVQEEHEPPYSSGLVTGTYLAGSTAATLNGELTITDSDGSVSSDTFTVDVLQDIKPREPNNTIIAAKQLKSGWVYLSRIEQPGDVDIFEIVDQYGNRLEAGDEARFELKDLPADLDLIILTQLPEGVASVEDAPWSFMPWSFMPWSFMPYSQMPWSFMPWSFMPWSFMPWSFMPWSFMPWSFMPWSFMPWSFMPWSFMPVEQSPYLSDTFSFENFKLSELGFAQINSDNLGSGDTTLSELGLSGIGGSNIRISGYSSNRGLDEESILVNVSHTGARLYAVVVGNNGGFGDYALQVETSNQLDREVMLGESCVGSPLVDASMATSTIDIIHEQAGSSPQTLIVTQEQRMKMIYNLDDVKAAQLRESFVSLADHELVKANVISLPSSIYDDWDSAPCNIDKANEVAMAIKEIIKAYLLEHPSIENIVIGGNDSVVPQYRIIDGTTVGNERLYATSSFLLPNSPIGSSIEEGYYLSDDFYASIKAKPWQGRELYLPSLVIARLVESPTDIQAAAEKFIETGGQLALDSAFVSGYDFFQDGANLTADNLSGGFTTNRLVNETWTADELMCSAFGQESEAYPSCSISDITGFNAHFSHFAAVSAAGFADLASGDIITATEVLASPATNKARLTFSMGCHSALSVPDGSAMSPDLVGLPMDPNADFVQALTSKGGIYIGNTGHGYGDTDGIAGSEKLYALFAKEIAKGGSVGQALKMAKLKYFGSLTTATLFDEKSVVQTTLYGLPMYQVQPGTEMTTKTLVGTYESSFNLTISDGQSQTSADYALERLTNANGEFFVIDGDHQATATRALQPRLFSVLDGAEPAHGVVIRGGGYYEIAGFDPVISRPTNEWEVGVTEPSACINAYWPTDIARVNLVDDNFHTTVVVPGQFRCTGIQDGNAVGTQRLYTSLQLDVIRSSSSDYIPPIIEGVGINQVNGTTRISVNANDALSGVSEVIVLLMNQGVMTSVTSGLVQGNGEYTIDVVGFDNNTQARIQVVDGAGNVAHWAGKGAALHSISVDAGPDLPFGIGQPVKLKATVANFTQLLEESDSMTYVWDFGDGKYGNGILAESGTATADVVVAADGSASFVTTHPYSSAAVFTAKLKISDSFGGVGNDEVILSPCGDPADLSSVNPDIDYTTCAMSLNGTQVSITVGVAGVITPDAQYRVFLDLGVDKTGGVLDGVPDLKIQYHKGIANGLTSLVVTPVGASSLRFDFDLAELGWSGEQIDWYATTQDGVQGGKSLGHVDVMPDTGFYPIFQ